MWGGQLVQFYVLTIHHASFAIYSLIELERVVSSNMHDNAENASRNSRYEGL